MFSDDNAVIALCQREIQASAFGLQDLSQMQGTVSVPPADVFRLHTPSILTGVTYSKWFLLTAEPLANFSALMNCGKQWGVGSGRGVTGAPDWQLCDHSSIPCYDLE